MKLTVQGGVLVGALVLSACTYDFDAPFSGVGGASATATGSSQGSVGPGGGDGGAATTATTMTSSASTTTSSSASTTTVASSSASSSSGGPDPITINCDGTCTFVPGDGGCCWDETLAHEAPQAECFTAALEGNDCRTQASPGGLETLISCQRPDQCADGLVCCAVWDVSMAGVEFFPSVECRSGCGAPSVTLCEEGGAACELGFSCLPQGGLPDGYFGCQP